MSDDTVEVKLASGTFVHDGEFKHGGDTFEVSEATADEHPELEPVSADESGRSDGENGGAEGSDTDGTDAEAPFDPGGHTVGELDARMADSDHSEDEREALADAERSGEDRDSAIDVLEP